MCVVQVHKKVGFGFQLFGGYPQPPMHSSMIVLHLEEQSYSILSTGRGYEIWTDRWLEGKIPLQRAKGMRGLWEVRVIKKKIGLPGCPTCDYLFTWKNVHVSCICLAWKFSKKLAKRQVVILSWTVGVAMASALGAFRHSVARVVVRRQQLPLPSAWLAVRSFSDRRIGVVKTLTEH